MLHPLLGNTSNLARVLGIIKGILTTFPQRIKTLSNLSMSHWKLHVVTLGSVYHHTYLINCSNQIILLQNKYHMA